MVHTYSLSYLLYSLTDSHTNTRTCTYSEKRIRHSRHSRHSSSPYMSFASLRVSQMLHLPCLHLPLRSLQRFWVQKWVSTFYASGLCSNCVYADMTVCRQISGWWEILCYVYVGSYTSVNCIHVCTVESLRVMSSACMWIVLYTLSYHQRRMRQGLQQSLAYWPSAASQRFGARMRQSLLQLTSASHLGSVI